MTIKLLLKQLADTRERLAEHGISDEAGYAELLVAHTLGASRNLSGVVRGYDVFCPIRGKVEVRSRTLPLDGRAEARIEIPAKKRGEFSWLAGVIFTSGLDVHEAYLLPHDAAWDIAATNKNSRTPLKLALAHPQAEVITAAIREAEIAVGSQTFSFKPKPLRGAL